MRIELTLAPPYDRALFGAASVLHLAQDFGLPGSVLLHSVLAAAHVRGMPAAFDVMLLALGAWHVPRHLARVAERTAPSLAIATAIAGASAAVFVPARVPAYALLRAWPRRIVVVHALLDARHHVECVRNDLVACAVRRRRRG